jgi:hypothetical protein
VFDVWAHNPMTPEERTEANTVYHHWGASIDAYEHSVQVSNFLVPRKLSK